MQPNPATVTDVIRRVAAEEIMPRFRALADHDMREKKPGDLVTTADLESERRLSEELRQFVPNANVIGEEAAETDSGLFHLLRDDQPVWIIDPLDGTRNFAHGKECFCVIVALWQGGKTRAGWIHDPLSDRTVYAAEGQGAWEGETRLKLPRTPALSAMRGSLGRNLRERLNRWRADGNASVPAHLSRAGCVGREYMDLAFGTLHFARYGGRLKPWDHAAGVLIHGECGGRAGLTAGGADYTPKDGLVSGTLVMAPDAASWDELTTLLGD